MWCVCVDKMVVLVVASNTEEDEEEDEGVMCVCVCVGVWGVCCNLLPLSIDCGDLTHTLICSFTFLLLLLLF